MKRIRRGMTLLELLLAVSVTSTVALGIVGMMDALTNGIIDQRDTRASILRAGLSQTRVSSYIARARCLLDLEDHRVVMWLEDTDGDEAVDGRGTVAQDPPPVSLHARAQIGHFFIEFVAVEDELGGGVAFLVLASDGQRRQIVAMDDVGSQFIEFAYEGAVDSVSYTHLTLPTKA